MQTIKFIVYVGTDEAGSIKLRVTDHYARHGYPDYDSLNPSERNEDYAILAAMKEEFPKVSGYRMDI